MNTIAPAVSPEKMIDNNTLLSLKEKKDLKSVVKENPEQTQRQALTALEQNYNIKNIIHTMNPKDMNREQIAMIQLYVNLLWKKIAIDGVYWPQTTLALNNLKPIIERTTTALPTLLPKPTIDASNLLKNFPNQEQFEKFSITDRGVMCVKYLMSQWLQKHVASGIVWNLYIESDQKFDTKTKWDGWKAFWLAQWHPDRQAWLQKFANTQWLQKNDYRAQLGYIVHELPENGWKYIKSANSPINAAELFCKHFERPSIPHLSWRTAYAKKIYDLT